MRRTDPRFDPSTMDLSHPCPQCGYKIPPAEIMHVDSWQIMCPRCQAAIPYGVRKAQ